MPGNEKKVCKLIKSLYGLKQAPKQWHQKFDKVVLTNGYLLIQADKCIYIKFDESGKRVIICLYVDEMLIFGTDQLMPNNGQAVSQLEYSRVIGCLMYAMTCTRPDIAFAMGKLSRCDSAATLAKAYSQMYNGKSRHLGIRHSMIPELITNGVISIEFVRSQQNLADHLTKGLARDLVIKSAEGMGLNGLKHMYLHIIPRMCLEYADKEDEVVNFLMVNLFEKVLCKSMNKEEPPMYSNGLKGSILRTP
ncbi:zinc finger, CCHC-type containing protein [Tanacetum coccineum]